MSHRLPKDEPAAKSPWRTRVWLLCGIALVLLSLAVTLAAWQGPDRVLWAVPGLLTVLLGVISGLVYMLGLWLGPKSKTTTTQMVILLSVAIAMRVVVWPTPAVPGSDCWRYLWDGAVTASGLSPYRYSPNAVLEGELAEERLERFGEQGRDVLGKINHPHLRTIYPPIAQGLFATAYWLRPFSLASWRVVLFCFDMLAAIVVLKLLQRSRQHLDLWAVYLWNPLLVSETYRGGHLDLVVGTMLILFVSEVIMALVWV